MLSSYVALLVFVRDSPQEQNIGLFVHIFFHNKCLFRAACNSSFCCLGKVVCQKLLKIYSYNSYICKKNQEHQKYIFCVRWVNILIFYKKCIRDIENAYRYRHSTHFEEAVCKISSRFDHLKYLKCVAQYVKNAEKYKWRKMLLKVSNICIFQKHNESTWNFLQK